jgi:putative ABC transport system substrate-binding protein
MTSPISRRSLLRSAAAALASLGQGSRGASLPRVAIVFNNAPSADIVEYRYYKAFVRGLRERRLEPGRDLVLLPRSVDGHYDRLPQLMQELVSASVGVIVAIGPGVGAARRVTRTIPIVAVGTDGLVEFGAAASLARPGGNLTGLTAEIDDFVALAAKRLQLLHEAVPSASRVAVLGYNLHASETSRASLESAARPLRQTVVWAQARSTQEFTKAFAVIDKERADALYIEAQAGNYRLLGDIVEFATARKMPSMFEFREGPERGGLLSYGADLADLFTRSATLVDKILKGANPGDLPIEQPVKFDLVVNRSVAKTLGVTVPPALLTIAELI